MYYSSHQQTDETFSYAELLEGGSAPHAATPLYNYYIIATTTEQEGLIGGDPIHSLAHHPGGIVDASTFVTNPPAVVGSSLALDPTTSTTLTTTATTTTMTTTDLHHSTTVDSWGTASPGVSQGHTPPPPPPLSPPCALPFESPPEFTAEHNPLDWSLDFDYIYAQDDGGHHIMHNNLNHSLLNGGHHYHHPYDFNKNDVSSRMAHFPAALEIPDSSSMHHPYHHLNGGHHDLYGGNGMMVGEGEGEGVVDGHFKKRRRMNDNHPHLGLNNNNGEAKHFHPNHNAHNSDYEEGEDDDGDDGEDEGDDEDNDEVGEKGNVRAHLSRFPPRSQHQQQDEDSQSHQWVGFSQVPLVLFDTATIPIWQVLTGEPPNDSDSVQLDTPVSICAAFEGINHEVVTDRPQEFDTLEGMFQLPLKEKLLGDKITLHLQMGSYHAESHPITLVHDSLKDKPSVITPDVFFFPQLVVIKHLSSCNSKATLSKRHKSKRVKEGGSWCHNPTQCKPKKKCSCQAYPSRHIKKGLRSLLAQMKKYNSPDSVLTCGKRLYKMVSTPSAKQVQAMPDYNSFLAARADRWGMFMMLRRYCEQHNTPTEVARQFADIWKVSQAKDNIIFQ